MTKLKGVAVCTLDDIGIDITGEDAGPVIESLNEYLSEFAEPVKKGESGLLTGGIICLNCSSPLGGFVGTFQWGIVNGEGTCSECGWPARALHRPKDDKGEIFDGPLEYILQYHPSLVTKKGERETLREANDNDDWMGDGSGLAPE